MSVRVSLASAEIGMLANHSMAVSVPLLALQMQIYFDAIVLVSVTERLYTG